MNIITSKLMGGLGNMLFQVAAGYSLSKKIGAEYLINKQYTEISHGHSRPKSPSDYLDTIFNKLVIYTHNHDLIEIHEPNFRYNPINDTTSNIILHGYYQSYKYFNDIEIQKLFAPDINMLTKLNSKYPVLQDNTVSLHIRRGDYITLSDFHHNLSISYYNNAIKQFPIGTKYLVFSDDIDWCKNIFIGNEYTFIESQSDIEDLYLMSLCKHNIIANSTFSWWAAWLNCNTTKTVIYPNRWFGPATINNLSTIDMFPADWVCINE
jgi:hypothetical protein